MRRIRSPDVRALSGTLLLTGLLATGGCDSGPPPIAGIALAPGAVSMTFLGETVNLTATLTDEEGANRTDVTPEWTSSNPSVVTISPEGVASAIRNGTAVLQASAGGVTSNPVTATVSQEAASIEVTGGDLELTFLGETAQLGAVVTDQGGSPVDEAGVSWISSRPEVASVAPDGTVIALTNGGTNVRATADGASSSNVSVTVEQVVTVVSLVTDELHLTFLGQTSELEIVAEDAGGSPVANPDAEWTSSDEGVATVDDGGVVRAVTEGTARVTAGIDGVTSPAMVVTVELGTRLGERISGLSARQGEQFVLKITVPDGTGELHLAIGHGTGNADFFLRLGDVPTTTEFDFSSTNPGNIDGVVLGDPAPGDWFIVISATTSFSGLDLMGFARPGPAGYDIDLLFVGDVSEDVRTAARAAAARWEQGIVEDLPGLWIDLADLCGVSGFDASGLFDDLSVRLQVVDFEDGQGAGLARASWCLLRGEPDFRPVAGIIELDAADVGDLLNSGQLESTILHELGHVIGFDPRGWELKSPSLIEGRGGADPIFTGPLAREAFDDVGGASFAAAKVPLENTGGGGARDGHWRESVFEGELMSPFIEAGGAEPLSIVTLQAFADFGYAVDLDRAEEYALPGSSVSVADETGGREGIWLIDDLLDVRGDVVDGKGFELRPGR